MVYATVANGGVSYFPRLIKDVVDADGNRRSNDKGEPVISQTPKVHGDLRSEFRPEQIELARRGLVESGERRRRHREQGAYAGRASRGQNRHGAGDVGRQER